MKRKLDETEGGSETSSAKRPKVAPSKTDEKKADESSKPPKAPPASDPKAETAAAETSAPFPASGDVSLMTNSGDASRRSSIGFADWETKKKDTSSAKKSSFLGGDGAAPWLLDSNVFGSGKGGSLFGNSEPFKIDDSFKIEPKPGDKTISPNSSGFFGMSPPKSETKPLNHTGMMESGEDKDTEIFSWSTVKIYKLEMVEKFESPVKNRTGSGTDPPKKAEEDDKEATTAAAPEKAEEEAGGKPKKPVMVSRYVEKGKADLKALEYKTDNQRRIRLISRTHKILKVVFNANVFPETKFCLQNNFIRFALINGESKETETWLIKARKDSVATIHSQLQSLFPSESS